MDTEQKVRGVITGPNEDGAMTKPLKTLDERTPHHESHIDTRASTVTIRAARGFGPENLSPQTIWFTVTMISCGCRPLLSFHVTSTGSTY